jgi:transcriptional regulator with XRE-family HTH domain
MVLAIQSPEMKSFTVRDARRRKGFEWTQDQLAAASGVDQTTISGIETGKVTRPAFDTILKLAQALKLRPEQLAIGQERLSA